MQMSTRGRYAVMALTDLAAEGDTGAGARAVPLASIAERQHISQAYLEQLFARLRRQGLVQSVRGAGGGYRLARPAEELSVAEVVTAVDEPLKVTRCPEGRGGCMPGAALCRTHDLWAETGRRLRDYLAAVSLADVVAGRLGGGGSTP